MKVAAVNLNSNKVKFGEMGVSGTISSYANLIKPGETEPIERLPIHNYECLKVLKKAQQAMVDAAKFTHEEVLAIANIETLPKRLEKIADIMQLKKIVKM